MIMAVKHKHIFQFASTTHERLKSMNKSIMNITHNCSEFNSPFGTVKHVQDLGRTTMNERLLNPFDILLMLNAG